MELPFAEDIGHYWKTSRSSPDEWLAKVRRLIEGLDGEVVAEGFGLVAGKGAFMMAFKIGGEKFKVVWPVLPSRAGTMVNAKR